MCSDKGWSCGCEHALVTRGWSSLLDRELGVLEAGLGVLQDLWTLHGLVWLDHGLNDVDALSSGTVSTCHLVVHLRYGSAESVVSVLLVHVNYTGSGKILQYDTVVLDGVDLAREDLTD